MRWFWMVMVMAGCASAEATEVQRFTSLELVETWRDCESPEHGWPIEVDVPSSTMWQVELHADGRWLDYPAAVEREGDGTRATVLIDDCHGYEAVVVRWWE